MPHKNLLSRHEEIVERLIDLQARIRAAAIEARTRGDRADVVRETSADTIYRIDADVEGVLIEFCSDWSRRMPLVLIAEGIADENGAEGARVFPAGLEESRAPIRLIVDPIDGTRGLMYDKRSAWSLAGVAPNHGPATRLSDIEAAAMTELPTAKMRQADVVTAIRGGGARARRIDLDGGRGEAISLRPSTAAGIEHGFASVSSFFSGTKLLAAELMERIAGEMTGGVDVRRAAVFDDQYISTAGQFYELMSGHDRFCCDLRPLFYAIHRAGPGLCVHPYDCAAALVADEAGVVLTDGLGRPLDATLDCVSDVAWAGFANDALRRRIEPIIIDFLLARGLPVAPIA